MKKDTKTYCLHCGGRTGFGVGIEPKRYDIHWCSSKCWQAFFQQAPKRNK